MKKTILIDFDGVIHSYEKGWNGGKIYGKPVANSLKAVKKLIKEGYRVVVFTSRENLEEVEKWLKKNKFPKIEVTNKKIPSFAIIDDRAIRFTNWVDVLKYFV